MIVGCSPRLLQGVSLAAATPVGSGRMESVAERDLSRLVWHQIVEARDSGEERRKVDHRLQRGRFPAGGF